MATIIATGKRKQSILTIIIKKENIDVSMTFNGVQNKFYEDVLKQAIKEHAPVGGTYWLKLTDLFAYNLVLHESFFDEVINIISEGDLGKMPSKKELIY